MVKLSDVRWVIKYQKRMKDVFHRKGMYRIHETAVEKLLKAKGITVHDPEEFIKPPPEKYVPNPEEMYPDFRSGVYEVLQEQKKEELEKIGIPVWHLSDRLPFTEGFDQACLLTKTHKVLGLPPAIGELISKYSIEDQDRKISNTIWHSQRWDNTKVKFRRRVDVENLSWKFRREMGIPDSKSATYILHDFLRYAQTMSKTFPGLAIGRHVMYKPETHLQYLFRGETINIAAIGEFLLYGNRELPPLADKEFVQQTADTPLFDMYPISPTIDLEKRTMMPEDDKPVLHNPQSLPCSHPQILVRRNQFSDPKASQAYNVMVTFATAYAEARARYGNVSGPLKKPVTVMNINASYNTVNFLVYQLNTMDIDSPDGVKNIVWLDNKSRFFKIVKSKPWKDEGKKKNRLPEYVNYHDAAFNKFLAMYLYSYDSKKIE